MAQKKTTKSVLGKPVTANYLPIAHQGTGYSSTGRPSFSPHSITAMMPDPRIIFGLWLIKGPILSKSRFFIDCRDLAAKKYIAKNLTRFWRGGASRTLKSIEWGYSCSEVLYKKERDKIFYFGLKDLHPLDCTLLTLDGMPYGAKIKNVPDAKGRKKEVVLVGPKALWNVHSREFHPYYGRSRLYGAFHPWNEYWCDGGAYDSRRLFFYKYAFAGPTIFHPPGMSRMADGTMRVNKDLAREIGEKARNGAVLCIPNDIDPNTSQRVWDLQQPSPLAAPPGLLEYGKDLKDDMWEGMGIPPEVARAEGTGAFAGRKIPMDAFFSILQDVVFWLIHDFSMQVIDPLMNHHFPDVEYEIVPFPLRDEEVKEKPVPAATPNGTGEQAASLEEIHYSLLPENTVGIISEKSPNGYVPHC